MNEEELRIGLKVRNNREFSGVPKGTTGVIVEQDRSWPKVPSVAVHWQRYEGDKLIDWFNTKTELQYLEGV